MPLHQLAWRPRVEKKPLHRGRFDKTPCIVAVLADTIVVAGCHMLLQEVSYSDGGTTTRSPQQA
jgi:hypothetical protein